MQTFLPYPDFRQTFKCLDNKRLGKQRLETFQILNILTHKTQGGGWSHHPAILMWKGYETALADYYEQCIWEWILRGFKNSMPMTYELQDTCEYITPHWLGDARFHESHKSNLLRKDMNYYGRFFPNVSPLLPYYWPKGKDE